MNDPHAAAPVLTAGAALDKATATLVLVHGRGADASGMFELARLWAHPDLAFVAPQAVGYTWYPYSFLAPLEQNEPYLGSALALVDRVVSDVRSHGMPADRIVLAGFSQGACLTLEYAARHPARFGAVIGFSGGLIGPPGTPRTYSGSVDGCPVFLGCSDIDPHIPLERVHETADTFERLGAVVDKRIYPGMGHTISKDEIQAAGALISTLLP